MPVVYAFTIAYRGIDWMSDCSDPRNAVIFR
jgi:hypothetical protein